MTKTPIAKLVPPTMDKGYSFQIINATAKEIDNTRAVVLSGQIKGVNPFIQGQDQNWIMVEFWCDDLDSINQAADVLFQAVGLPFKSGSFTRQDLGLSD